MSERNGHQGQSFTTRLVDWDSLTDEQWDNPPADKILWEKRWRIRLDAPLLKQVVEDHGINLAEIDAKGFEQLADNPMLFVDVLYSLLKTQCDRQNVSESDFGRSLAESIDAATLALLEAIANFFEGSRRELLRALHRKQNRLRAMAASRLDSTEMDTTLEAALSSQLTRQLDRLSTAIDLPAKSE